MIPDLRYTYGAAPSGRRMAAQCDGRESERKKAPQDCSNGALGKPVVKLSVANFDVRFTLTPHGSTDGTKSEDHERPSGWFGDRPKRQIADV